MWVYSIFPTSFAEERHRSHSGHVETGDRGGNDRREERGGGGRRY